MDIPCRFHVSALPNVALKRGLRGRYTNTHLLVHSVGGVVNHSMSYFLPIILRGDFGFSSVQAQCLVAPPYIFAAISMYVVD